MTKYYIFYCYKEKDYDEQEYNNELEFSSLQEVIAFINGYTKSMQYFKIIKGEEVLT